MRPKYQKRLLTVYSVCDATAGREFDADRRDDQVMFTGSLSRSGKVMRTAAGVETNSFGSTNTGVERSESIKYILIYRSWIEKLFRVD